MDSTQVNQFMNAGYSFLPCGVDKRPWIKSWEQFQYQRPQPDQIADMPFLDAPNVALLAGQVSGGLECIDFDLKNDPTGKIWERFKNTVKERGIDHILKKTTIQETMSGGYHIIYKCEVTDRSQKLALPVNSTKPIIETRGDGGYFLVWPSQRYKIIHGSITDIGWITPQERETLLSTCKTLSAKQNAAPAIGLRKPTKKLTKTVEKICKQIEEQKIDITADYDSWVKAGHGIAHHFGEGGRHYFHRVSAFHPDYDITECNKKYDNLLIQRNKRTGATIKSFFAIARDYGIDIRDDQSTDLVQEWVQKQALRWNMITNKVEDKHGEEIDDFGFNNLWLKCRNALNMKLARQLFDAYVFNYDQLEAYNPITEYFDELLLRPVVGDPITMFLDHLILNHDEWKPLLRKWLVGVVAGAYGYPSELIPVLVGEQHNGKTEFYKRLLPKKLKDYCVHDKLDQGKDSDILMTKKLIIFDDEFQGKSKKDASHLKALASVETFSIRLPYGKVSKDLKRLCALAGCTNHEDIINDNTGNRRILPIKLIERIYPIADEVDRENLWAALVQEYFNGDEFAHRPTNEEVKFIKGESEDHQSVNPERDLLLTYFTPCEDGDVGAKYWNATMVLDALLKKHPGAKIFAKRMGQELTLCGFKSKTKRFEGVPYPLKVYILKPTEFNENLEIEEELPF